MKKQLFSITSLAVAAALIFSGCHKDDDDDEGSIIERSSSTVSFSSTLINSDTQKEEKFSTSDVTYYTSVDEEFTQYTFDGVSKIFNKAKLTSIVGKKGDNVLSITYRGRGEDTDGSTYSGYIKSISNSNAKSAIQKTLKGLSVSDDEKYALENLSSSTYTALVIYKGKESAPGDETFYYSETADVTIAVYTEKFITGCFSAVLKNTSGDTFTISDGVFNVLGKK